MSEIKVINIIKGGEDYTNSCFDLIVMFDHAIDDKKIPKLKKAIQDYINRPEWAIVDSGIEFTHEDGSKSYITKHDLDSIIKSVYPEITDSLKQQ